MMSQTSATLAWNHPCICTYSRTEHKAGHWSQNKEPNTKISATPQGNIRPALPFPSKQGRVGSAQLHPTSTANSPREPPQPWQADGDCSGKYTRRELLPPPPWARASYSLCAPCTASMCQVWTSSCLQRDSCITGNQLWEGRRDGARPAC